MGKDRQFVGQDFCLAEGERGGAVGGSTPGTRPSRVHIDSNERRVDFPPLMLEKEIHVYVE